MLLLNTIWTIPYVTVIVVNCEVSSILSYVHFLKKMRFCYFCWIKINIIFGLIYQKKIVVGGISAGSPNHTIRLLWKFYFIVSRYFLAKHVHDMGSGFEYVEKIMILYTSME